MRVAEEPFPGDPRRGAGHSGEDHRNLGHQVSAVPPERDAVHPGEGLPGRSRNRASKYVISKEIAVMGNRHHLCCPGPGARADVHGVPVTVGP